MALYLRGLAKRIIPCLDVNEGRVVKGVRFLKLQDAGDPVGNAVFYDKAGADELVFLDITASFQKRKIILDVVRRTAESIFMPFTVGGGIRSLDDIRNLLNAGADKVSINTAAVKDNNLITKASLKFGSQCTVVAIDARLVHSPQSTVNGKRCSLLTMDHGPWTKKWEVYINGGRTPTGLDAVMWAKKAQRLGAGEILLTSMDYDGTKLGYDIKLTSAVSEAVSVPVIASGGAGQPHHIYEVFKDTKADAALCASIFHYRHYSIREVKEYLKEKGIKVRI